MKLLLATAVVLLSSIAVLLVLDRADEASKKKAERFDQFCSLTTSALLRDLRAFEAGNRVQKREARDRFFDSRDVFHGSLSIEMCVGKLPELPRCWSFEEGTEDWECFANNARNVYALLERR